MWVTVVPFKSVDLEESPNVWKKKKRLEDLKLEEESRPYRENIFMMG